MKRKYTKGLTHSTEELKKLIAEHPTYPIVILCSEDVNSGDYSWCFASDVSCSVGELLDCEAPCSDTKAYNDRDDFEEDMMNYYADSEEYKKLSDEEYEKAIQEVISQYDEYWIDCIFIYADA